MLSICVKLILCKYKNTHSIDLGQNVIFSSSFFDIVVHLTQCPRSSKGLLNGISGLKEVRSEYYEDM